jgi:hypothetical protein
VRIAGFTTGGWYGMRIFSACKYVHVGGWKNIEGDGFPDIDSFDQDTRTRATLRKGNGTRGLGIRDFDPRTLIRFHQGQLSSYRFNLLVQSPPLCKANGGSDGTKESYDPRSLCGPARGAVWSGFILLLSAALLKFVFYLLDAPRNPIWLSFLSWDLSILAFLLVAQGTVLQIREAMPAGRRIERISALAQPSSVS